MNSGRLLIRRFAISKLFEKRFSRKSPKKEISLAPKFLENLKEWPKVLEAENAAQFEKLNEMIQQKVNWKIMEERGYCVGNLLLSSKYYDAMNGEIIVLSGDSLAKSKWLKTGIPVTLNRLKSEGGLENVSDAHIVGCSNGQVKLCVYDNEKVDFSTSNYILTPTSNSGARKQLENILKNPNILSENSVHLVNLAYKSVEMPSIHDRKIANLPDSLNPSQTAAVSAALNSERNLLCIQGPPGTGKTHVIAEIVHQLIRENKKVLVCAPTHVAVRNVMNATAKRMKLEIPEEQVDNQLCNLADVKQLFRMHPLSDNVTRLTRLVAKTAKNSLENKNSTYKLMKLRSMIFTDIFSKNRAIFTTLGTSFIQKLPEYSWDADVMLVDEAAQCTEPSTWVPVLTTPKCKKLVLVGDQKQLPAVVLSDQAIKSNLKQSLMEKLAEEFAGSNINILLQEQYRMNENIMRWSNEVFYENQLIAHESVQNITLRDVCSKIPKNSPLNNPIIMIDMDRKMERSMEEKGTKHSFTNKDEVDVVRDYVNRLVVDAGLDPQEIAVISPYYAQIEKLREAIRFPVDVNTVDAFQGHERQVVIFCLVRDNKEGDIGFLRETRRLNVAITRAKRQFVLVGSGRMLRCGNKELKSLYKLLASEKVIFGPNITNHFYRRSSKPRRSQPPKRRNSF